MKLTPEEKRILSDNRSGSSEILLSSVKYIQRYLEYRSFRQQAKDHIVLFLDALVTSFPAMAIIKNGSGKLEKILRSGGNKSVVDGITSFLKELEMIDNRIIENCRVLFKHKVSIVTYSNSGLVKKVLGCYRKMIKRVYVSESRPDCEGRKMADHLDKMNIPVTYCIDMALPTFLSKADYVITGADGVGRTHFVNKTGTGVLLQLAGLNKVKRIVVFESLKRLKNTGKSVKRNISAKKTMRNKRLPCIIDFDNSIFESIPLEYVDFLISEKSIESNKNIR